MSLLAPDLRPGARGLLCLASSGAAEQAHVEGESSDRLEGLLGQAGHGNLTAARHWATKIVTTVSHAVGIRISSS
jgi:hypothetical protein